jgi:hypothetical protein
MQISPTPTTWAEVFRLLIATSIGLIPFLVTTYRNRKKSDLENKEMEARAELARVNARSTEFRDNLAAGEGVGKLLSALIEAGDTIHELQGKNFRLEQEKLGEDMLRLDLKRATALLAYHSISFHSAEHADVKKMVETFDEMMKKRKR